MISRKRRAGSPGEVEVLGVIPCGKYSILEQSLHGRFKHIRVRGEWFKDTPELRVYITREASAPPPVPVKRLSLLEQRQKNAKRREQYRARANRSQTEAAA